MNITENNYILPVYSENDFDVHIEYLPTGTNYFEESLLAAQKIEAQRSGKLYIMYSGGIDSEYAISVFDFLKIDFTPVIIKFHKNYNKHDVDYALKFCEKKGIEPLIVDLDFDYFVKSGDLLKITTDMKCSIYHRAATAYVIGKLDGTVLCGDGEPYIRLNEEESSWEIKIFQHDYSIVNYYINNGIYGTPHFNRYTPQMMRTFLEDPRMYDLANNKVLGKLGSDSSKYIIYNRYSNFFLSPRPKYHGYELIENLDIFKHEDFFEIKRNGKIWDGIFKENYFKFLRRTCMQ